MKRVYRFRRNEADGGKDDRRMLGGKGADLAEMSAIGLNVPPGFTVTTEACLEYMERGGLDEKTREEIDAGLDWLEEVRDRRFGDPDAALLVSVRSGAPVSMPGMMDTVLNLGCNREVVEGLARETGDRRFALDTYRRLIQMFTNVVKGIKLDAFEEILDSAVDETGVESDSLLPANSLEGIVERFLETYEEEVGEPFPDDPREQVRHAVAAVFDSWNIPRARKYREIHGIADDLGTAANVQSMVYGNLNRNSGSGVGFTRDPATGDDALYGEWLVQAQGEDVVAGVRTPHPISASQEAPVEAPVEAPDEADDGEGKSDAEPVSLEEVMPEAYEELLGVSRRLERHFREMQDFEFTIEDGELFVLQTRRGQRTAAAAVKIAVDLALEGTIERSEALRRVDPDSLEQLLHPRVADEADAEVLTEGLPASPGAAVGRVVLDAEEAERRGGDGEAVILVRPMTMADDVGGMSAAAGILTARGGMTSHAAVVARGMGQPCIVGAGALEIDAEAGRLAVDGREVGAGDWITIDGSSGRVYVGKAQLEETALSEAFETLMEWADETRRLGVRANADTPDDARRALEFGAGGIGLCRTEHMFFASDRLSLVRRMILAGDDDERRDALERLEPLQRSDFEEIFRIMDGLPVTVRLLDPPLHEFLPDDPEQIEEIARELDRPPEAIRARIAALDEVNPMLGLRGCRLGIVNPEIYEMQLRAILKAAATVAEEGGDPRPEIMLPLVAAPAEVDWFRRRLDELLEDDVTGDLRVHAGVMIETPRACLVADQLAPRVDFFSVGSNDLTQTTFAFSRDDAGSFLPRYRESGILEEDPFHELDVDGVGDLIETAVRRGRGVSEELTIGICGEHGGRPAAVRFCDRIGLDYVSCSPFRVPVARLAAARSALDGRKDAGGSDDR